MFLGLPVFTVCFVVPCYHTVMTFSYWSFIFDFLNIRGVARISSRRGPQLQGPKVNPSKFKKSSDFIHYFLEGAQINGKLVIKKIKEC